MKEKKGYLLIVIVFALIAGLAIGSMANKNKTATEEPEPPKQEEQQQTIEDEYLKEEDLPPVTSEGNDLDNAYNIIKPYVDEAFAGVDGWTLTKEGENGIVLTLDIPESEMAYMSLDVWQEMVQDTSLASERMKQVLEQNGIYDIHFAIAVGDVTADVAYLIAVDGIIMLDVPNGVNNLE